MLKVLIALSFVLAGLSAYADSIIGVGLVLGQIDHNTRIEQVLPDTPAAQAGAQVGEYIVAVNGQAIYGVDLKNVVSVIRGPIGTSVVLTLGDLNGHNRDLNMIRAEIIVPNDCFIEGLIQLSLNTTDPAGSNPFTITGLVGNEIVNWYAAGGSVSATYKGENLQLNYETNGVSTLIHGTVHGTPVNWTGAGHNVSTTQVCIP